MDGKRRDDPAAMYRGYIACLSGRNCDELDAFVRDDVAHNGWPFGLAGYRGCWSGTCG